MNASSPSCAPLPSCVHHPDAQSPPQISQLLRPLSPQNPLGVCRLPHGHSGVTMELLSRFFLEPQHLNVQNPTLKYQCVFWKSSELVVPSPPGGARLSQS